MLKRIYWTSKAASILLVEGAKLTISTLTYIWEVEGD